MFFEIYNLPGFRAHGGGWHWRLKSLNGRVIATSEHSYRSEQSCRRATWRFNAAIIFAGRPLDVVVIK